MSVVLNAAIKQNLTKSGKLDVGQFHLLNMDMVKIAAGAGWPAMREKIFTASKQFIEKRIRSDDMLILCEEGFLLIFADATPEEANHRIERLGVQMREFFLGTPVLSSLGLRCEAKSVTAEEFVELAGDAANEPEGPPPVPMPEHGAFEAAFEPIWDSQKQIVAANLIAPICEVDGRERLARDAVGARLVGHSQAELDVFTAKTAIAGLRQLGQDKTPAPMRFSVHFETIMAADARQAYLKILSVAPKPMRRYFQLHLDCPPLDRKETLVLLRELREFGATTVLDLPFDDPDMRRFADCGVGIYLCEAPKPRDRDEEGLLDRHKGALARFVEAAKAQRAWTHLAEARDVKTVKDGAGCGARFLSGAGVGGAAERPIPPKPFSLIDLVQRKKAA